MKSLINLTFVLSVFTWLACGSEPEAVNPKIEFGKEIDFKSQIYFWDQAGNIIGSGESARTDLFTSGVSRISHFERFDMKMTHIRLSSQGESTSLIEQGVFEIQGENEEVLHGSYTGYIQPSQAEHQIELILKIEGGNGNYYEARGHILAKGGVDPTYTDLVSLDLEGKILLP